MNLAPPVPRKVMVSREGFSLFMGTQIKYRGWEAVLQELKN